MDDLRERIDKIDTEILDLLHQRAQISMAIGNYKNTHGLPVLDKERERLLIERLRRRGQELELDPDLIESLYELVLENSRSLQKGES